MRKLNDETDEHPQEETREGPLPDFQPGSELKLGTTTTVLVAEDHEPIRQLLDTVLRQRGLEVALAADGAQAVAAWSAGGVALVLMDVHMPVMDGLEATRRIRQMEEGTGHHTPIIALTAFALRKDWEEALAAGMDDYLTKPINRELLLATIDRYMQPE